MFSKLRRRIIIITMAITTIVLFLAGGSIMLFSSTMRPEPRPFSIQTEFEIPGFDSVELLDDFAKQEVKDYIKTDRKEGSTRLLATLFSVGIMIELIVFLVIYYLSKKIVEPVKDSYNKQKLFIANASHELKTPLAVIQANIEALEVDEENEKWKNNIETEIAHANTLVLNLLKLARMDAGAVDKSQPEEIDLFKELRNHIEMFRPKFSGKMVLGFDDESRKYHLPKQDVLQIVDILLDNAVKYGDKKIVVKLNQNSLVVTNDGTLVAENECEKIFDRFYQTDKTKEGSGLGLAIAKAISERNNWAISCESKNHLTAFKVVFNHR